MKYTVRDRETWNWIIGECNTIEEGEEIIRRAEEWDKAEGCYEPNCYEVVEEGI